MAKWVNYREVKDRVTFAMVFEHYGLLDDAEVMKSGEFALRCPFHGGTTRTLKANDNKHGFQCFASECGKKGNVIDFVAYREDQQFRQAALLLQDWFMKPAPEPVSAPKTPAPIEADVEADVPDAPPAPPAKGRGYMREVEATVRTLIAADDPEALVKWVKEELLASYRRGVEKQKTETETSTR